MSINLKLAYSNFRRNKQDTVILLILGVLIFTLLISIVNSATIYSQAAKQKELQDSGKWLYYQKSVDYSLYQETLSTFDSVATIENIGVAAYETSYNVVRLSENFNQLVNSKVIQGDFPQAGQIALSQSLLDELGYQGKVGETVRIKYNDLNGIEIIITAQLSGIVLNEDIKIKKEKLDTNGLSTTIELVNIGSVILPSAPVSSNNISMFVYDQKLLDNIENNNFYNEIENKIPSVYNYELLTNSGYNANAANQFKESLFFLSACFAVSLICLTLMLGITLSSLSRRTREFALLRAIGQTKKQVVKMLLFQLLLIVGIAMILALPLVILGTWLALQVVKQFVFSTAILVINSKLIIGMLILGILIIFIGMFIPIFQASKKALSGTFDEQTFKYFEVRYQKLHYQKPLQLAKRQLIKSMKLNFILIIILTITFSSINNMIIAYQIYQDNLQNYQQALKDNEIKINGEESGLEKEQITQLEQLQDQVYYGKKASFIENGYSWDKSIQSPIIEDGYFDPYNSYNDEIIIDSWMKYYTFPKNTKAYQELSKYIEGRMAKTANEVVLYLPYYRIVDGIAVLANKGEKCENTIKLNSKIRVYQVKSKFDDENNEIAREHQFIKEYKVVGIIRELPDNNLLDFDLMSMIITEEAFDQSIFKTDGYNNIYIKARDQVLTLSKLNQLNNTLTIKTYSDEYAINEIRLNEELEQAIVIFIFVISLSIFLFSYLARYRIINNTQEIGILRSIGMTKLQLYQFYSYQILILCLGGFILSCYIIAYEAYNNAIGFNIVLYYLLSVVLASLMIMIIYCLPLRKILRQDILDLIKIKE